MGKEDLTKWLVSAASFAGGYIVAQSILRSARKLDVSGKVVLITGGSRGLGLILARKLADQGAKIAICGRNEETLKKAADELSYRTPYLFSMVCDIAQEDQAKNLAGQVNEKLGPIDILINNAGILQVGGMENLSEEDFRAAMDVHFWGPFYIVKEVYPSMKERRQGRIVNIVSIGGKLSFPHLLSYNASKFALSGFSEGIAAEMAEDNIHVTTVYPGLMRTGSPRNVDFKGQQEKEYAWFKHADSMPILSVSADKAANRIINAMRLGQKSITLSIPAKVGRLLHEVAPELTLSFFDIVNRFLPDEDKHDQSAKKGYEIETEKETESADKAARANNEEIEGEGN